jgi:hypothetical protein
MKYIVRSVVHNQQWPHILEKIQQDTKSAMEKSSHQICKGEINSKIDLVDGSFIAILPERKTNLARREEQYIFREEVCLGVFLSENVLEGELAKE